MEAIRHFENLDINNNGSVFAKKMKWNPLLKSLTIRKHASRHAYRRENFEKVFCLSDIGSLPKNYIRTEICLRDLVFLFYQMKHEQPIFTNPS